MIGSLLLPDLQNFFGSGVVAGAISPMQASGLAVAARVERP
ncbi:MAG: hypothetical protein ACK5N0_14770 [Synechococcaceae cyanobacterium]